MRRPFAFSIGMDWLSGFAKSACYASLNSVGVGRGTWSKSFLSKREEWLLLETHLAGSPRNLPSSFIETQTTCSGSHCDLTAALEVDSGHFTVLTWVLASCCSASKQPRPFFRFRNGLAEFDTALASGKLKLILFYSRGFALLFVNAPRKKRVGFQSIVCILRLHLYILIH